MILRISRCVSIQKGHQAPYPFAMKSPSFLPCVVQYVLGVAREKLSFVIVPKVLVISAFGLTLKDNMLPGYPANTGFLVLHVEDK